VIFVLTLFFTAALLLTGFDSRGEEFFGSFEDAKQAQSGGGDGFDPSVLDNAVWGEPVSTSTSSLPPADFQDMGTELESVPSDSQDLDGAVDANGDVKKKDDPESRRRSDRRKHPSGRSSRPTRPVEVGVESMKIDDADNGEVSPAVGGAERKDRKPRGPREEDKDPRKRSSSKSKRKARAQREGRPEKPQP
jgi:hypothetical protein